MLTKEFFDKHFNLHNKIVLYTPDNITITISKAYHFHFYGGHRDFDIHDSTDLANICKYYNLSTKRHSDES